MSVNRMRRRHIHSEVSGEELMTNYLEKLKQSSLSSDAQELVINEAQRTGICGVIPDSLSFLRGGPAVFIDLGFEHLGLPSEDLKAVRESFVGNGVGLPGTGYKLRCVRPLISVIEPDDGVLALPPDWAEAVFVSGENYAPVYVGKRVPPRANK
jgi:hypothetical protein